MAKSLKGKFIPKNPQKYLGNNLNNITYRSSWELTAMIFFILIDEHPNILGWMSESIPRNHAYAGLSGIPYINPFTGKSTFYVPDFFIVLIDRTGKQKCEVLEIKPMAEVPPSISGFKGRVSKLQEARRVLNAAKYEAALKYCAKYGFSFRLCTEKDMFAFKRSA